MNIVKSRRGKSFPDEQIFDVYRNHPLNYFSTQINEASVPFYERSVVFYLMYDGKRVFREQDVDHIHPTNILAKLGIPLGERNVLPNFQLLESGVNRGEKNGKEFKEWVEKHVEDTAAYARIHLIPEDRILWTAEHYRRFAKSREHLIIEHLKTHL